MTELQMGLIALGIVAVAGVLAYNKWQEARQRRQAEGVLEAGHRDVLLEGGAAKAGHGQGREPAVASPFAGDSGADAARVEPVLHSEPEQEAPEPELPLSPMLPESALSSESSARAAASPEAAGGGEPAEDLYLLSPLVDFIVGIDAVEAVPARQIVDAPRAALARVRKPVRWIGYDPACGEWQLISQSTPQSISPSTPPEASRPPGEYRHIRAGLQLVDRQGAVSEDELAIFATAMQELADQLTGVADIPSRQGAFEAALALDRFCANVDVQIGINVISQGQVFLGTKLRALAESAGMVIDEGRFVYRDNDGNVLFVLLNQETPGFSVETVRTMSTKGLTFLLDVPCVANGERVFNRMIDLARQFADVLHGALVDDNRHPLSTAALDPIRQQINQYQAMLAARQLPAGSPLTRRLFA
ncbi:MAG: cell division protein FtsZ [Candidatus Accumulibacter sp.]|jgi:hypothetical protein|nr:cell division protein FtsZ [Accumulibacter sp.]